MLVTLTSKISCRYLFPTYYCNCKQHKTSPFLFCCLKIKLHTLLPRPQNDYHGKEFNQSQSLDSLSVETCANLSKEQRSSSHRLINMNFVFTTRERAEWMNVARRSWDLNLSAATLWEWSYAVILHQNVFHFSFNSSKFEM